MNEMNETAIAVDAKRSFAARVARGMFRRVTRHLRSDIAEDRLAEDIAMAFELFATSVAVGRPVDDAIARSPHATSGPSASRGVSSAPVVRTRTRDVFDERNYHGGHVELLSPSAAASSSCPVMCAPRRSCGTRELLR